MVQVSGDESLPPVAGVSAAWVHFDETSLGALAPSFGGGATPSVAASVEAGKDGYELDGEERAPAPEITQNRILDEAFDNLDKGVNGELDGTEGIVNGLGDAAFKTAAAASIFGRMAIQSTLGDDEPEVDQPEISEPRIEAPTTELSPDEKLKAVAKNACEMNPDIKLAMHRVTALKAGDEDQALYLDQTSIALVDDYVAEGFEKPSEREMV